MVMNSYHYTHAVLARGFASKAPNVKQASLAKYASRRWLEDNDLVKLCQLFKENKNKKPKRRDNACK